jgi:DNA-binding transcriptional LysR family regulator
MPVLKSALDMHGLACDQNTESMHTAVPDLRARITEIKRPCKVHPMRPGYRVSSITHDPDLQSLKFFLAVYELGSVTRAAEQHNIAVSAVTKRIQDLEANYRVRLFDRQARGVVPTLAGDELAVHARDLCARLGRLKGTMGEFAEGIRGHVRVHASCSIIMEYLAAAIAEFVSKHPLIRVELIETTCWSVVHNVFQGHADVGLISAPLKMPPELAVHPYCRDRLVAVLPYGHPLADLPEVEFAQLLDYEHVGIATLGMVSVQLAEVAAHLNRTIQYSYQIVSCDAARWMVAAGLGVAVLPDGMITPFQDAIGVCSVPLSDPWAHREIRTCIRNDVALPAPVRLFLTHLMQE